MLNTIYFFNHRLKNYLHNFTKMCSFHWLNLSKYLNHVGNHLKSFHDLVSRNGFFFNEDMWKKRHWYFDFQYDTHVIKPGISTIVNNKWLIFKLIKNTFKRACQLQLVTVTTTSGTATSSLKINTVGSLEFTLKRFLRGSEELSVNDTKPNDCCLQLLKATRW